MDMNNGSAARAEILARLDDWAGAVRRKDLDQIMSFYLPDVVAFDAIQSLQFKGAKAYGEHWKACLEMCSGGVVFTFLQEDVQARDDLAAVRALVRCGMEGEDGKPGDSGCTRYTGTWCRVDGQWMIAHEHFSAPIDMMTGRAMWELDPAGGEKKVRPIPLGMPAVTPHLVCAGAARALEFYKTAFGASEESRLEMPGGKIGHACMRIDGSAIFLMDEMPQCGAKSPMTLQGTPVSLHLYVRDVDAAMKKALDAGATEVMAAQDMFWGDRYGVVADPFGHQWSLATHVRDLSQEEIERAGREMMSQMEQGSSQS